MDNNVKRLKTHYQYVHTYKMSNVPILNNKLAVETVGFVDWGEDNSEFASAVGVLITPWFMNLVLLPKTTMQQKSRVGQTANILFPDGEYSFLTQLDDEFGVYLTCSLFSPMFDFSTQAQAVETAEAIMAQLLHSDDFKKAQKEEQQKQQSIKDHALLNSVASRRDFLRGKASAGGL